MKKTTIGIIIGSIREKAESARMAAEIEKLIRAQHSEVVIEMFSLREHDLPLWTEDKWKKESEIKSLWHPISARLKACDGFVVISPEWAGMVPPHLKNFLLMCDGGELAHKPGQLVSVSAGAGGAYPIAELRMSGYKNNFICWLPDHVILRQVGDLFTSDTLSERDSRTKARIEYSMNFLVEMAQAMKPVWEKHQNLKSYKNGM
ncbi:MAG: NAD(P)H-dependent oxidoreductase [Proteobacteria bacterium]|nr:NAD(P)H-dependent oxidoreductase [Pseudomonadota bacterium]